MPVHVEFVVDIVALEQIIFLILRFSSAIPTNISSSFIQPLPALYNLINFTYDTPLSYTSKK